MMINQDYSSTGCHCWRGKLSNNTL